MKEMAVVTFTTPLAPLTFSHEISGTLCASLLSTIPAQLQQQQFLFRMKEGFCLGDEEILHSIDGVLENERRTERRQDPKY